MADRATGVSQPALSSHVRNVASVSPRDSVPASFLPTPLPAYVPVSQATSTRGVARRCSRLPLPRRAYCRSDTPTGGLSQATHGAATV